jgi:hypothetical protein
MAKHLPNGNHAEIPLEKLLGYCLNPNHPSGKHKARVFASALGITITNPEALQKLIQQAAIDGTIIQQDTTEFGQIFKVDWHVPDTNITLRTIWEIKTSQPNPRLISAFVK